MAGLTLVPTPIGNMGDITLRALEVLKAADLILAEDTRVSGKLLKHHGISTPMKSYHQFNEARMTPIIVDMIEKGRNIALVSDAGTPGISDPGHYLIRACIARGHPMFCLPGPAAFLPALLLSGFDAECFSFYGFIPKKKGRKTFLSGLAGKTETMVFYESPHRLVRTLQDLAEIAGDERPASVSREITKLYEETVRGTLAELIQAFSQRPVKGEMVIVLQGSRQ